MIIARGGDDPGISVGPRFSHAVSRGKTGVQPARRHSTRAGLAAAGPIGRSWRCRSSPRWRRSGAGAKTATSMREWRPGWQIICGHNGKTFLHGTAQVIDAWMVPV